LVRREIKTKTPKDTKVKGTQVLPGMLLIEHKLRWKWEVWCWIGLAVRWVLCFWKTFEYLILSYVTTGQQFSNSIDSMLHVVIKDKTTRINNPDKTTSRKVDWKRLNRHNYFCFFTIETYNIEWFPIMATI
jgi:hypothetical protein